MKKLLIIPILIAALIGCEQKKQCLHEADMARWKEKQRWMDSVLLRVSPLIFEISLKWGTGQPYDRKLTTELLERVGGPFNNQ